MIQICECNIFFPCAIDYFIGKDLDQQQCIEKKEGCASMQSTNFNILYWMEIYKNVNSCSCNKSIFDQF